MTQLTIIGVPYDLDRYRVGKGKAPEVLLAAGLDTMLAAHADVQTVMLGGELGDGTREERLGALLHQLAAAVAQARHEQRLPIILGGDCLCAIGVIAGLGNPEHTAVAWIDAHGDFNTPASTISGYLGGMPLACVVGRCLPELHAAAGSSKPILERNIVLLGVRDLDKAETDLLGESEITVMSALDIIQREGYIDGARNLLHAAPQLYVHLDIDVLSNQIAPGVDYPAPGGLSVELLHELVASITSLSNLSAVALTAVNPERDCDERTVRAALDVINEILRHV